MKKEYSVERSRRHEFNLHNVKRASKLIFIFVTLYMSFAALTGSMSWTVFLYSTLIISVAVGLGLIIGYMSDSPLNNTLITITEDQIIRSGEGLLTVRLNFNEIKRIKTTSNGTTLFKEGWGSTFNYHTNRYALISEFGIIFVPFNIQDYDDIITVLNDRISC